MSDRAWLRTIMIGFAVVMGNVSYYVWTQPDRLDATDLDWAYRILLPVATLNFALSAVRPSYAGIAAKFLPLSLVAGLRIGDFLQDWWITPSDDEAIGIETRVGLASVGWLIAGLFNLLMYRMELALREMELRACANAPDCPTRMPLAVDDVDGASPPQGIRHRLRSVARLNGPGVSP